MRATIKFNSGFGVTTLNYDFNIDANDVAIGFSAVALLIAFVRRRKTFLALATVLVVIAMVQAGCSKNGKEVQTTGSNLFVRIAQIDKDGTKTYSRVIQVKKNSHIGYILKDRK